MKPADALTQAFRRGAPRRAVPPGNTLEPALYELWRRARDGGPDFGIEAEEFIRYAAERLPVGPVGEAFAQLNASDLLLAMACARGQRAALAQLEHRHLSLVGEFISQVGREAAFVDEVRQRLREKLLVGVAGSAPKMADYAGRGPLGGWIRVAAIRTATNCRRDERPPESKLRSVLMSQADPELAAAKRQASAQVGAAMRRGLAALSPEDRSLLKMHHVDGLTVDQLAPLFRAHRSTVARWINRAREQALKVTLEVLREELGHDSRAARSLLRFARSQLDLSLPRLLGPPGETPPLKG
jgi:RNA polymerase sigma-70 factor, ECF subfamily